MSRVRKSLVLAGVIAVPLSLLSVVPAWASTSAGNWTDLDAAFNAVTAGNSDTIILTADITQTSGDYLHVDDNSGSGGADITLDLNGHSLTISGVADNHAGIEVAQGASLTVDDSSNGSGQLTVTGGLESAAIGGYYLHFSSRQTHTAGAITINQGVLNLTGSPYDGAALGGSLYGNAGTITINGGQVTATSQGGGAGIGGGFTGYNAAPAGSITITGGTVTATGAGGGAGIGSGTSPDISPDIVISGGTVSATGNGGAGNGGAGIGTGSHAAASSATITISGGTVTASGNDSSGGGGAGIGGGVTAQGAAPAVTISGCSASIVATGGPDTSNGGGAGIGNGGNSSETSAQPLTIDGVASSTSATTGGAGYAGDTGSGGLGSPITFSGSQSTTLVTVVATDGQSAGDAGSFTYSCADAVAPSSPSASPDLAGTGVNAAGGIAVVVGLLALGAALALAGLARRRCAANN